MVQEQSSSVTKHWTVRYVPLIMGGSVVLLMGVPLYTNLFRNPEHFLAKEVVTLEGKVVDERYVSPAGKTGQIPSQYFFSIDDVVGRRIGIEVIDSYEPPLKLEYVNARLKEGTQVKVKARQVGDAAYKAFANDVCLPEFQKCD